MPAYAWTTDGAGFSFASIWAHNDNLGVTSCTIITAPAVPEIAHIHTRMPVIVSPDAYGALLDTSVQGTEAKPCCCCWEAK